jgi:antitoxin component YwqK of YwqJK toxin-antitoxin module
MRTLFYFAIAFFLNFDANAQNPSYELDHTISIDTINKIDRFNQKQGKWVIRGKHLPKNAKKCFEMGQVIEKGIYLNNRKTGTWTEYYCNGKTRS